MLQTSNISYGGIPGIAMCDTRYCHGGITDTTMPLGRYCHDPMKAAPSQAGGAAFVKHP